MDILTPAARSSLMSRIRSKNTRGELLLRSVLHRNGLRFRLHRRDMPGTPDVALPKYRAVVFLHGCFWHQHPGCRRAYVPTTNTEFWGPKLKANVDRFERQREALTAAGWRVFVVWECEIQAPEEVERWLVEALRVGNVESLKHTPGPV